MHFTDDIDIPDPLIESLSMGDLVIFVGAGVSAKAYHRQKKGTFYPLFPGLVKEIGMRSGITLSRAEKRLIDHGFADRVLGEWKDRRIEVHSIAAEILQENEKEQRIKLHEAIIRLFPNSSTPLIVTTNFDNLLVRALPENTLKEETEWPIYEAPTLPPVKRFAPTLPLEKRLSGICFLHGRVTKPQEMILTDRDIGRAYMDEGWALKFAHDLFREFKVLFIGYSLQDPPLRYLSLALETAKDKNRWAIIPEPKDAHRRENLQWDWERRGVVPIWYPAKHGTHTTLEKCITAWSKDNRRGFIDRRNLLYEWGLSDPAYLLPYQLDRARYFLGNSPELLRDFVDTNLNKKWFDKLIAWGHLDFLLRGSGDYKVADSKLAQLISFWLMENPTEWLVKLTPYRETLNPILFEVFLREFKKNSKSKMRIDELRKVTEFFSLILKNDYGRNLWLGLDKVLKDLIENGYFEDTVWLFLISIKSHIKIEVKPNFNYIWAQKEGEDITNIPTDILEYDYSMNDSQIYHARKHINKIFIPHILEIGYLLLKALTYYYYDIRLGIKRGGGGGLTYINTKAIEQNEDTDTGGDNLFINSFRDLWDALLISNPDQATKVYEMWQEIADPIFQRLSLYALRKLVENDHVN